MSNHHNWKPRKYVLSPSIVQVRAIIERIQQMPENPVEELSDLAINFYQSMNDRLNTHSLYKGKLSPNLVFVSLAPW